MFIFLTSRAIVVVFIVQSPNNITAIAKLQVKHANANYKQRTRKKIATHIQNEVTNNKNTCLIHSFRYNAICTNFTDNSAFAKLLFVALFPSLISSLQLIIFRVDATTRSFSRHANFFSRT